MKRLLALLAVLTFVAAFALPADMAYAQSTKNPCNPCAAKAKNPCNPDAVKANPCAAKAKNPCNPSTEKKQ